jgi:gliding motility-associated-like protein
MKTFFSKIVVQCFLIGGMVFLSKPVFADVSSCDSNLVFPNSMTNNGDEIPQPFKITFKDSVPETFSMQIYTRWGKLIFTTDYVTEGWNGRYFNEGKVMEDGTYYVVVTYKWKHQDQIHKCESSLSCIGLADIEAGNSDTSDCETMFVADYFGPQVEIDGRDIFKPQFQCPPFEYDLKVYNRWETLVFETTDYTNGWDGTVNGERVQPDAFIWEIKYVMQPGDEKKDLSGHVSYVKY